MHTVLIVFLCGIIKYVWRCDNHRANSKKRIAVTALLPPALLERLLVLEASHDVATVTWSALLLVFSRDHLHQAAHLLSPAGIVMQTTAFYCRVFKFGQTLLKLEGLSGCGTTCRQQQTVVADNSQGLLVLELIRTQMQRSTKALQATQPPTPHEFAPYRCIRRLFVHFQVKIYFWAAEIIEKVVWKHCNQFRSKIVVVRLTCSLCGSL